jgi:hypothetical protein
MKNKVAKYTEVKEIKGVATDDKYTADIIKQADFLTAGGKNRSLNICLLDAVKNKKIKRTAAIRHICIRRDT